LNEQKKSPESFMLTGDAKLDVSYLLRIDFYHHPKI